MSTAVRPEEASPSLQSAVASALPSAAPAPEQAATTDEPPMSLGDSTMLRLLLFCFVLLWIIVLLDLVAGFW